ncbi:tRNA (N6-threonylcarbamoyladenosine(37)-N6)-methyltransferase TrmO [Ruminococcus albus]|uniref:Methyltransferase, YaeB family n=2 Tax=Ruminococcus TaxID=1263 RepID=E9SFI7_RUMAL|nr:tRNA (N6-threonylcarbamoyladenosine(37)-N6)-methyltransferase TrmO [Ruminococcus albus]EGC01966.1 methyltransferase, YaeB family [Ruminococcus albus 8]MBE6875054.1 tRNA (N6-threonylcarbamoyladenosine(37)-N6)-methyltransferase TrmO [Ruminococcus albus]MCC3349771.1 tRNA (N6-threonylcarbamoyladenosine(37)-N6)-methyltransferase TrmO [Ruminococcus albus 8]
MKMIAKIHTDLPTKFGLPRQSGLVEELEGLIVFEPAYRDPEALRGIEGFSHLWLIWEFSEAKRTTWSPTVRPPRLGGNKRMGVFATRSPFRPNPIGLSCVKLLGVEKTPDNGTVLRVGGADLMDGTPIFDIKPYLPLADCKPDATGGFAAEKAGYSLKVDFPAELLAKVPTDKHAALKALLAQDPRPAYQHDPSRIYGFGFAGLEVRFRVEDNTLHVTEIEYQMI